MAVINILKNGTVVEDISKVKVPVEIVQTIAEIAKERKNNEKEN